MLLLPEIQKIKDLYDFTKSVRKAFCDTAQVSHRSPGQ
jgi:hypothetical protein